MYIRLNRKSVENRIQGYIKGPALTPVSDVYGILAGIRAYSLKD